jgi:hypothetical protein
LLFTQTCRFEWCTVKKRVLIVYYSYTQQTRLLLKRFREGLEQAGVVVTVERLEPLAPFEIPFRSNFRLLTVMVRTFFRQRSPVQPVAPGCYGDWDRIVIAGPTWSYQPSGPILAFLDREGKGIFAGQRVLPLISCRSYWRVHYWSLRRRLRQFGAEIDPPLVFCHPIREPWRVIGLLLQLRGKMVRRGESWFRRFYPAYGHSPAQIEEAYRKGRELAAELTATGR